MVERVSSPIPLALIQEILAAGSRDGGVTPVALLDALPEAHMHHLLNQPVTFYILLDIFPFRFQMPDTSIARDQDSYNINKYFINENASCTKLCIKSVTK